MKIRLFPIFVLAVFLLGGCAVEEIPSEGGTLFAVMENDQTRTAVTDKGIFTWSSGDQVWLHTTEGHVVGILSDGAGTSSAEFKYDTYLGEMTGKAVYPHNPGHSISGDVLNVVLPASYDLGSALTNTNAAMYGVTVDGTFKFNHLAGVMRFSFKDVPAGTDKFIITLDKKINGTFTADLGDEYPLIETSAATVDPEKSITLNFDPLASTSDIKLYVPLPVGTYGSLGLALYAGEKSVWTYSNTVSNTIGRKTLKLMPVVTIGGSIGGDIDNDGENPDTGVLLELLAELEDRKAKIADHLSSLAIDLEETQLLREDKMYARSEKEEELAGLNQTLEQVQQARLPLMEKFEELEQEVYYLPIISETIKGHITSLYELLDNVSKEIAYYKDTFEDLYGSSIPNWEDYLEYDEEIIDFYRTDIQELSDVSDMLSGRIVELQERLAIQGYEQGTGQVRANASEPNVEIYTMEDIEALEKKIDAMLEELEQEITHGLFALTVTISDIDEIDSEITQLCEEMAVVNKREGETNVKIQETQTEIQELNSAIENLDEDVKKIQSEYSALQEVYESLQKVIPDYKAEIIAINESIDGIRTDEDRETVKQNIETLQSTMTAKLNEVDNVLSNI